MQKRHIVAMGGYTLGTALEDYVLGLARGRRVLCVPTAGGEDPWWIVKVFESLSGRADVSLLLFHPWPPENLREYVLGHDLVLVPGGNTANMLAIWRAHGLDKILREAWEDGIVLCGWSAGMICWFEAGVTDSFGPELAGMRDGLGFLAGSACPHYDGEELRRPRYHELVAGGFPGGVAADDHVGLHYVGTELAEVVSAREGASAYGVDRACGEVRETALDARVLE
ncbi:MAG: Type 1 glutamine amidotransferase-like domain-containing protein [Gaiellaceae bacterium]